MLQTVARYPGFAFKVDTERNPFLVPQALEAMDLLAKVEVGRELFARIEAATPAVRSEFPKGINVIVQATEDRIHFVEKGHKLAVIHDREGRRIVTGMTKSAHPAHSIDSKCRFHIDGTSSNSAVDKMAESNGKGSVCYLYYSNAQIMTRKEEPTIPHIVLAHELIHSSHSLAGTTKDEDEEEWTTGIGEYKDEPMSENAFRAAFGLAARKVF